MFSRDEIAEALKEASIEPIRIKVVLAYLDDSKKAEKKVTTNLLRLLPKLKTIN